MTERNLSARGLSYPLDPKEIEERLWRIDLVNRSDYDTDEDAFAAVKSMVFALRLAVAKAAANG